MQEYEDRPKSLALRKKDSGGFAPVLEDESPIVEDIDAEGRDSFKMKNKKKQGGEKVRDRFNCC